MVPAAESGITPLCRAAQPRSTSNGYRPAPTSSGGEIPLVPTLLPNVGKRIRTSTKAQCGIGEDKMSTPPPPLALAMAEVDRPLALTVEP